MVSGAHTPLPLHYYPAQYPRRPPKRLLLHVHADLRRQTDIRRFRRDGMRSGCDQNEKGLRRVP